jgi:hypothetical protein
MSDTPFKALEIGPDGWAHGVMIGRWLIDRPVKGSDTADVVTEIVDAADCAAMIAAFKAGGEPLLVDRDHSADLSDSTEAYGWIRDMRACPDGAEVLLELTDIGAKAIAGKRWRFLSAVFPWEDFIYDDAARLRGHPRRVSRFAFTNRPRMRGIRPVVNAEGAITTPTPKKGTSMDYKAKLLSMLGLADTATDEEIQAAIDAASGAKADADADAALNAAGIPDSPAIRDPVRQAFRASPETGANALNAVKAVFAATSAAAAKPAARAPFRALNAEARTAPPALNAAAFDSAREQAIESASKTYNLKSRADAVARAQRERPDLWQ